MGGGGGGVDVFVWSGGGGVQHCVQCTYLVLSFIRRQHNNHFDYSATILFSVISISTDVFPCNWLFGPSLVKRWTYGFSCTVIFVCAVHTKMKQAWMSLHKC